MSYVRGRPLRSREVLTTGGRKAFAYACGKNLCDTNVNMEAMFIPPRLDPFPILRKVFQGRLVGIRNGRKLFAIASECAPQPITFPGVEFINTDWWPPFGVTDVLLFKFVSLAGFPLTVQCFGGSPLSPCPFIYLTNAGGRSYSGSYSLVGGATLTVTLTLVDVQDPDRPLADGWPPRRKWELTLSGCVSPSITVQAHATCYFPLRLGGQGFTIPLACCPASVPPPDVGFAVEGFTNRRIPARLVHAARGRKVFYTNQCCDTDRRCEVTNCCGCDVTPYQYTVPISGIANGPGPPPGITCGSVNGTLTLTYDHIASGTDCVWTGSIGTSTWALRCFAATGKWQLSASIAGPSTPVWQADMASWSCLGPNVMTLFSTSGTTCTGFPASVTVTPV